MESCTGHRNDFASGTTSAPSQSRCVGITRHGVSLPLDVAPFGLLGATSVFREREQKAKGANLSPYDSGTRRTPHERSNRTAKARPCSHQPPRSGQGVPEGVRGVPDGGRPAAEGECYSTACCGLVSTLEVEERVRTAQLPVPEENTLCWVNRG